MVAVAKGEHSITTRKDLVTNMVEAMLGEVATKAHSCNHTSRHEQEYIEKMLRIDDDGLHYIDYFNEVKSEFDDPGYDYPQYLDIMRN